jgi:hypothetical protein
MTLFNAKLLVALAGFASATVIWAADPPSAVTPAKVAPAKDPNKMVCKKIQALGTLFPKKLCKTAREWDEEEALAKDTMKRKPVETVPTN